MIPDNEEEFVRLFGGVYEHSPWIALRSWPACQMANDASQLAAIMASNVERASKQERLDLIRAHPDLAGKLAVTGELTAQSSEEQASAGLDQCSSEEFDQFQSLNDAYKKKFDFPFVLAVRGRGRGEILSAFSQRLGNSYEVEFAAAISEIHKIALLRMEQII